MVHPDMARPWHLRVLTPVLLVAGLGLPLILRPPTPSAYLVIGWLSGTLLLGALGTSDPARFRWAYRAVAVSILAAYSSYSVFTFVSWLRGRSPFFPDGTGQASVLQSLLVLVIFGAPALRFLSREDAAGSEGRARQG